MESLQNMIIAYLRNSPKAGMPGCMDFEICAWSVLEPYVWALCQQVL
jgi:hypothetical protein